jgi:N-acyl-D-aspartate/D-glutamate deacylase
VSGPKPRTLLAGGAVCDGTGRDPVPAELLIEGDRIAAVGPALDRAGARVVDVVGLVVAPGFIDLHAHSDFLFPLPFERSSALLAGLIRQGITTEILGNCGLGAAPVGAVHEPLLAGLLSWMRPEGATGFFGSVAAQLDAIERAGPPLNVGTLLAHGPVRIASKGLASGAADAGERAAMAAAVERGLEEGAFGLSTGLIYPPGIFTSPEEILPLAVVLRRKDRIYTSHIRGSSELLLPAVDELLDVARASGCAVHHSHSEAVGRAHWKTIPRVLEREDAARRSGLRVSSDMFPYGVAATMLAAIFPPWALEGGLPGLVRRLGIGAERARIARDIDAILPSWPPWGEGGWPHNLVAAVGWAGISIASVNSPRNRNCVGLDLAALGRTRARSPFEAVAELMIEEEGEVGMWVSEISGCETRGGVPDAEDLAGLDLLAQDPAGAFCTDAVDTGRGSPHPAAYGAFPRVLGRIVRQRRLMPLGEAVRRLTSRPAGILGLSDRGLARPGQYADLVVFDPERVLDEATLGDPRLPASGIPAVFVNGVQVVRDGVYRAAPAGRVLRG